MFFVERKMGQDSGQPHSQQKGERGLGRKQHTVLVHLEFVQQPSRGAVSANSKSGFAPIINVFLVTAN